MLFILKKRKKVIQIKIGYSRVSTANQNHASQIEALKKYGCEKIFIENESGLNTERPELKKALEFLRDEEDTLVVYSLDRLGRNAAQLLLLIEDLNSRKIEFISLSENFNSQTPLGKAMISLLASIGELNVNVQNEKIKAGLEAARKEGRIGGRPRISDAKIKQIHSLLDAGNHSFKEIGELTGVSRRTVINYKNKREQK